MPNMPGLDIFIWYYNACIPVLDIIMILLLYSCLNLYKVDTDAISMKKKKNKQKQQQLKNERIRRNSVAACFQISSWTEIKVGYTRVAWAKSW